MKRQIKIMLVEDNPEYRLVIDMALKREPGMELVSQEGTTEYALQSLNDMAKRTVPDLILLDLNLPGMSGIEALPHFLKLLPDTKIIVLTQSNSEADVLQAISFGAHGYLLKSATVEQIMSGITTVIEGGASLDPSIARFIVTSLQKKLPKGEQEINLSGREFEILQLLGEGLLKKEIADKLNISIFTVVTHIRHIYSKLKVQNAPAAITSAYRLGILPTDD